MKVFDLNVVRRLQLPEEATWMIIQYLKEVHPVAVLIKALRFGRYRWPWPADSGTPVLGVYGISLNFKRPSIKYGDPISEMRFQYSRTNGERRPYPIRYSVHSRAGDPEPPHWSDSEIATSDSGLNDGVGWDTEEESEEEA